jgi:hypothetical protein
MQENLIVIACGVMGVLFQSLLKLRSLLKDAQVANVNFNWKKDYVYKDGPSIIMAFLSVFIWYYIFGEVSAKYNAIIGLKRVSFVLMGGVGSYLIQMAFGTAKERIRKIVDRKTDQADGKVTPDELTTKH